MQEPTKSRRKKWSGVGHPRHEPLDEARGIVALTYGVSWMETNLCNSDDFPVPSLRPSMEGVKQGGRKTGGWIG